MTVMPKLLIFAPCSLATVDAFTGGVSLALILTSLTPMGLAQVEEEATGPQSGESRQYLIPPFSLFTQWWREEGDEEREFEQCVDVRAPDGKETTILLPTSFILERPFHRVFHRMEWSTFRMSGLYLLRVKLREVEQAEWQVHGEYPLLVEEIVAERVPPPPGIVPSAALRA
jgi:hypothetical protein